jgi:hypothetical protein
LALNINELNSVTNKLYKPVIVDNIFKEDPLLNRIKQRIKVNPGGSKIVAGLTYGSLVTGEFGVGTTFDISKPETITSAEYAVKGIYGNMTLDGFEQILNAAGNTQIHDALEEKSKQLENAVREELIKCMIVADNTANGKLEGLVPATKLDIVYGGIDRATNSFWQPNVSANGGTLRALTLPILQDMYMKVAQGSPSKNLVLVTSNNVYNKIWELLMDKYRVVSKSETDANLGFDNITFNGKPVFASPYLTRDEIYFVDFDHFRLELHKEGNFALSGFKKAQNTAALTQQMQVVGNFTCDRANKLGIIKDIDPAL